MLVGAGERQAPGSIRPVETPMRGRGQRHPGDRGEIPRFGNAMGHLWAGHPGGSCTKESTSIRLHIGLQCGPGGIEAKQSRMRRVRRDDLRHQLWCEHSSGQRIDRGARSDPFAIDPDPGPASLAG